MEQPVPRTGDSHPPFSAITGITHHITTRIKYFWCAFPPSRAPTRCDGGDGPNGTTGY
jgi:hypothetical protein